VRAGQVEDHEVVERNDDAVTTFTAELFDLFVLALS